MKTRNRLMCAVVAFVFCGTLSWGTTVYGYTGQNVTSSADTQFVITASNVCNSNTSGGSCSPTEIGSVPSNAPVVTTFPGGWVDTTGLVPLGGTPSGSGTADAGWIAPQANQGISPSGTIINGSTCCDGTTTFTVTLPSISALGSPVQLEVEYAADDNLEIELDSTVIVTAGSGGYGSVTTFPLTTVTSDLHTGVNTLTFIVDNSAGGPTGLLASFELTNVTLGPSTPEPATVGLVGIALLGLGAWRVRRKS